MLMEKKNLLVNYNDIYQHNIFICIYWWKIYVGQYQGNYIDLKIKKWKKNYVSLLQTELPRKYTRR